VIILATAQSLGLAPWEINVSTWKRIHREQGTNLNAKASLLPWGEPLLGTDDLDRLAGAAIALAARFEWCGVPTVTPTERTA
jgi:hypothetical protein